MKLLSLLFNQVTYEGWHKMWESGPHGLPEADIRWLKEDAERGLFQPQMSFEWPNVVLSTWISWSGGGRRSGPGRLFFSRPCVFLETSRCVGIQPPDCTQGNTMAKVWRQVQESHCEEYLQRKDLYTTLLSQLNKPGGITSKSDWSRLFLFQCIETGMLCQM